MGVSLDANTHAIAQAVAVGTGGGEQADHHARQPHQPQQLPLVGAWQPQTQLQAIVAEQPGGSKPLPEVEHRHPERDANRGQRHRLQRQQQEQVGRAGTEGAQDGELAAPLVKPGEQGGQHADQARHHHKAGDDRQGGFRHAHQAPQLLQGGARQDRHQRLSGIGVDGALQLERQNAVAQPHHKGGDGFRGEILRQRLLRGDVLAVATGIPTEMDRLDPRQRHMDGAIDGRAGRCQNAHHLERQVVVLAEGGVASAVGDDDGLAKVIAELLGHLGAEYRFERRIEWSPLAQLQRLLLAVLQVGEVVAVGAEHPKSLVGVTEGERDGPGDAALVLDGLIGVPAHVVGGVADAKHRVEQQIHLTGAGADDEIGARDGIGKAVARLIAHPLHPEQQGDADGDG